MLLRTHIAISALAVLLFFSSFEHKIALLFFGLFGTMLPDLDSESSFLGRYKLARVLQLFTKHRGILHSFTFLLVLMVVLVFVFPMAAFPLFLGYSLHLFIDSFTVEGIFPFYPSSRNVCGKIRTGKLVDHAIFMCFAFFDAILVFLLAYSLL